MGVPPQLPVSPPRPARKRGGWRWLLLALLFPIVVGSWWQTVIWVVLFCLLIYLIRPRDPAPPK
jgi:hypothetical protein